jgi:hypothetical protein
MKNQLVCFSIVVSLFSSGLFSMVSVALPPVSLNAAPPSFPTAAQAFKKIYSGSLSSEDAQTQPWYESYDSLYKSMNNNNSDPAIITLLANLQQQTITPDAAAIQFNTAQTTLKTNADNVFSS